MLYLYQYQTLTNFKSYSTTFRITLKYSQNTLGYFSYNLSVSRIIAVFMPNFSRIYAV
jgi:hypothetical protein